MLTGLKLTVGTCLAVLLTTAGCGQRGPDAPADRSTLATAGEAAVSSDEVMALLDPSGQQVPVRLTVGPDGGAEDADPLDQALRTAINDALLAQEAERRGVAGVNRAQKLSVLLERVRADIEEPDEKAVRAWYDQHRFYFDHVEAAQLQYVVLDSPASLDDVVAGLQDGEEAVDLVETHSAVQGGPLSMSHEGEEVPLMVERVVNAAKYPGAVSYDRDGSTGRWWIVRVDDVELEAQPWQPALATKVESAMRWEAEQEAVARWAASLEEEWPVVVHEENVERFERTLRGE